MILFLVVVYTICGIYMVLNLKYDLQMLQQNSYRLPRYWRWLEGHMATAWRLVDVALLFLLFSTLLDHRLDALIIAFTLLYKSYLIVRRKSKKPLVFTKRVWRLYSVAGGLSVAAFVCVATLCKGTPLYPPIVCSLGTLLLLTVFSWVPVILALIILMPVEKLINRHYYNDAKRILKSMPNLKVVGITGSYGKTSTKHYLNTILGESYDVLMTPGSYNTTMGVIRTVREYLKPYNEIFICEMGAKQKGDVKEICELVEPSIGVITAVGPMHLETFKTIDNVRDTKFELADALPKDGLAVINNDFEPCAGRKVDNCRSLRYAVIDTDHADFRAENISYGADGTSFSVVGPDGFRLNLQTRLLGECNISNLIAAVIVALELGVPADKIRYAVGRIEQVEHRLNVKRTPGGVTIIDDAFNSNPAGSRMAVDTLAGFTNGKRIIVTPGMVELGERQHELNAELGRHIGNNLDIAIIVGHVNRQALVEGLEKSEMPEANVIVVDSFAEAQERLQTILKAGDTVLYENDLPDTFR